MSIYDLKYLAACIATCRVATRCTSTYSINVFITYLQPLVHTQVSNPVPWEVVHKSAIFGCIPFCVIRRMVENRIRYASICLCVGVDAMSCDGFQQHCTPPAVAIHARISGVAATLIPVGRTDATNLTTREEESNVLCPGIVLPVVLEYTLQRLLDPGGNVRELDFSRVRWCKQQEDWQEHCDRRVQPHNYLVHGPSRKHVTLWILQITDEGGTMITK